MKTRPERPWYWQHLPIFMLVLVILLVLYIALKV